MREIEKAGASREVAGLPRFESRSEKALELLEKAALVDPDDNEIRKQIASFPNTIDRLKKRIEEALAGGRLWTFSSPADPHRNRTAPPAWIRGIVHTVSYCYERFNGRRSSFAQHLVSCIILYLFLTL